MQVNQNPNSRELIKAIITAYVIIGSIAIIVFLKFKS